MKPFNYTQGVVLPLAKDNVDTDAIIPQRWLITVDRNGLGQGLFGGWRYDEKDNTCPDFIINKPVYRNAKILLTQANYGCGSSREHAVWAHLDYGIRTILASSYGSIFYENCLKNGLLPVTLDPSIIALLIHQAVENPGCSFHVDLVNLIVTDAKGKQYPFAMDEGRRDLLLKGLDDVALTLEKSNEIDQFQCRLGQYSPWL